MKCVSSILAINHLCVGERWGGGKCLGVAVTLEKSGREKEGTTRKSLVWGGGGGSVGVSLTGGEGSGSKQCGASVNDLPKSKSINWNEWMQASCWYKWSRTAWSSMASLK
ncbi:hypothetical protein AVEN_125864-1 [Araneus ventricosus]|uniref:Uncharacterized protein n=1 Tax=Araneus ventricosus TaxID=182803 RepID=A0A4Y2BHU3_ARAVE|nr:hypothetical protein AVEN_125864-1 [Araneus ventricosus]